MTEETPDEIGNVINRELEQGDWIVHKQHGVGQIKAIEKKEINGKTKKYYRVKINSGVYWLPIKKVPEHIRAISSRHKLNEALTFIRKAPASLPDNYKYRNREVAQRAEGVDLLQKGELIRDLNARRYQGNANLTTMDERQLNVLRQQFLREMVIIMGIEMPEAERKLNEALEDSAKALKK